jgi:hypothetical protein
MPVERSCEYEIIIEGFNAIVVIGQFAVIIISYQFLVIS